MATTTFRFLMFLAFRPITTRSFSMSTAPAIKKTFYQRPLPDSCIAFSSPHGRAMFASALQHDGLKSFYHLIQQHSTQTEPAYCGISTLTISLNAFSLDPRQSWKGTPWRWYDESHLNCCVSLEAIRATGITLPTFACLAKCQGVDVNLQYAQDATEDDFREAVKKACLEEPIGDDEARGSCNHMEHILVVSYDRSILKQTGTGHFSPIAAYDSVSDSVLVLDTARFKYGVHWVSLPLMFQAMQTIDPDTGKSRGYVMLSNQREAEAESEELSSTLLPVSLMLQSTMKQATIRRAYKDFIAQFTDNPSTATSSISWDDVVTYWTQGSDASRIWTLTKPSQRPTPDQTEVVGLIEEVRSLISNLLPTNLHQFDLQGCCKCGPHDLRTLDLRPEEVLMIVYLASLTEEERNNIVLGCLEASDAAKEQLLAEAKLLRLAIDSSDAMDINLVESSA